MASASHTTDRKDWDSKVTSYRTLAALLDAETSFGLFRQMSDDYSLKMHEWQNKYGDSYRAAKDPAFGPTWDDAFAVIEAVDLNHRKNFVDPCEIAAVALAMTPAPDLDAAVYKIALIKQHGLDNLVSMPRDCMDVVREDLARVSA